MLILHSVDVLRICAGDNMDAGDNILRGYEFNFDFSSSVLRGTLDSIIFSN